MSTVSIDLQTLCQPEFSQQTFSEAKEICGHGAAHSAEPGMAMRGQFDAAFSTANDSLAAVIHLNQSRLELLIGPLFHKRGVACRRSSTGIVWRRRWPRQRDLSTHRNRLYHLPY